MKKLLCSALTAVAVLVSLAALDPDGVSAAAALRQGQPVPAAAPFKDADPVPDQVRQDTVRLVWETVRDKYFDPTLGGVDWNAVRTRYEPEVRKAATIKDFHDVLNRMVHELPGSHLNVLGHGFTQAVEPDVMVPDSVQLRAGAEGVLVFSVPEDSPVWRGGIRPGYRVIGIGDVTFPDAAAIRAAPARPLSQARRLLSGPQGSEVQVRLLGGESRERTVTLARTVPLKKRDIRRAEIRSFRIRPRIGYLRFDTWAFDLSAKLEPVLAELRDTDGLVLDLRQNGGGTNPGVDRLATFLMAEAGLVAVTTPRQGERREWRYQGSGNDAYRGKLAIIVDEASGSASEVFTAAMQESGRAVVVGRPSYGGVLSSTQQPLPTGGVLQYPHSDMTTPKGNRVEGRGVVPDIPVELRRADLLAGRDTVLERAVEAVQAGPRQKLTAAAR
jgi:carboxyl-terminal processing protease